MVKSHSPLLQTRASEASISAFTTVIGRAVKVLVMWQSALAMLPKHFSARVRELKKLVRLQHFFQDFTNFFLRLDFFIPGCVCFSVSVTRLQRSPHY